MKNILLLFLSDVKVSNGVVKPAKYKDIGETYTTNESAVRYLAQIKKAPPNKIFYFSSNKVKRLIKKDRNSTEDFTEDDKTFTHISYFEKCIAGDVEGDIANVMQPCNFDEDADIKQTMKVVVKMASMIQAYVQEQSEEVILNVDMTGGMRHASLMMLVIARLIQYSGVKIGWILYSNFVPERKEENFVEEANDIYNLFDIIAGAEEFVRFGSVDAILSYFKNKYVPDVLQKLLDAMKKFAEVIKISRRREFQDALEKLQTAYNNFSTAKNIQSLDYKLMQQLKVRIAKEYSTLLKCDADDYVSIIGWCLAHGYIQQALVLYTESFPYMIAAKDEVLTIADSDVSVELSTYVDNDSYKREKEFLLLNGFSPIGYSNNQIFLDYNDFIKKIKESIQDIRCNRFDRDTFQKNNSSAYWVKTRNIIQSDYDTYFELLADLQKLKADSNLVKDIETVAEKLPTLYSFWDLIHEDIFETSKGRVKKILLRLETNQQGDRNYFIRRSAKALTFHHMIKSGIFKLNIDEEKFFKIIDRYFIIKSERNDSVHARQIPKELLVSENLGKSYSELLKDYIQNGLDEYSDSVKK